MPLDKSKTKDAFGKNIGAELKAGKPMKQAVAIAYSVKRSTKDSGEPAKGSYAEWKQRKAKAKGKTK